MTKTEACKQASEEVERMMGEIGEAGEFKRATTIEGMGIMQVALLQMIAADTRAMLLMREEGDHE